MRSLFYVIGPSGAGKDSLILAARQALDGEKIVFAHRYVTRPVNNGNENFVSLSVAEFAMRAQHNLFLFSWASHDLHYAIGTEALFWLRSGLVVVNGSRAYLPQAQVLCDSLGIRLIPVWVTCELSVLATRLRARARESESQIAARLARATAFVPPEGALSIDNSGTLEQALMQWLPLLKQAIECNE
jgi:ribose 1,5-bisphosphokinase